jgi:deoxyribodipyrimidine photo-lyase
MLDIQSFFEDDARVHLYRAGLCDSDGQCVLYWMQNAQRGRDNPALNAAIAVGNALALPVVTLFVLTLYPAANLRHYTFLLEGLQETAHDLRQRGTPLLMRQGSPPEEVSRVLTEVHAAVLISDESATRLPRQWREELRQMLEIPFVCVDADVLIPTHHFPKEEWAARTLRPKVHRLLPTYLQPISDLDVIHPLDQPPCDPGPASDPLTLLKNLPVARDVASSPFFHGGQSEAHRRLHIFLHERLADYAEQRNYLEGTGTSELSAYLHFGQVSVQRLAWEIEHFSNPDAKQIEQSQAAFLEELIVRRELAINFALRNPHYDRLEGCPDWGRASLQKHIVDPREWIYTRDELEQARTHDDLWNACQREMVISGRMHNYMRMYWAKKLLEWSNDPQEAFAHAVYLNDKYELDGRDANGYTGIAWALGGRHDRPWGPERPIFGLVRFMSLAGMQRKLATQIYITRWLKPERG